MKIIFNRSRRQLITICMGILAAVSLTGCVPDHQDDAGAKETIEQGRPILESYVASLSERAEFGDVFTPSAAKVGNNPYMGYYNCNVAGVHFKIDGEGFCAYVDLETDQIWTDYGLFDVNKEIGRQLEPYFERYDYPADITVSGASFSNQIISHDISSGKKKELVDTYITLENMIPANLPGETAEERADACLKNAEVSSFDIYYAENDAGDPMPLTILLDYLQESGNYVLTEKDSGGFYLYNTIGMTKDGLESYRKTGKIPEMEKLLGNWSSTLHLSDDLETMSYTEQKSGLYEQDGFILCYYPLVKSGILQTYATDTPVQTECPVVIKDNILSYKKDERALLYFYGKPEFSGILVTKFDGGKEKEPQEYQLIDLGDGLYSITDGAMNHQNAYVFNRKQWIRFEGKTSAEGTGPDEVMKPQHTESQIRITYHNPAPLARLPRFEEKQNVIMMQFNGYEWYSVRVISAEEKEIFYSELSMVAESSNMKVYDNGIQPSAFGGEEQSFLYIFDPGDPAGSQILFETLADPRIAGYANDFTTNIQYFVGNTEVLPDIPKLR